VKELHADDHEELSLPRPAEVKNRMRTVVSIRDMQRFADAERGAGRRIGFVPTMGYLHEGHLSLVRAAAERADTIIVSIFVNPIQFNSRSDFEQYPRDDARDARLLEAAGVDALFLPSAGEMYPAGFQTRVEVMELTRGLCGAHRPGHFAGVTTVVSKLFLAVKPHVAVFGRKDCQQLAAIRRMVEDLNFDVEIVPGETVREADGLAMSSRNARLSPSERERALAIPRGFARVGRALAGGIRNSSRLRAEFEDEVLRAGLRPEYAEICDPNTLEPIDAVHGEALFAVAVWVGEVRLIDNEIIGRSPSPGAGAPASPQGGEARKERGEPERSSP
jgi:pantoate--beta-alanine ligase